MFRKMSFRKSNNTSQSELPIAESTHIEDSTPSKNSKLTWSNKFGLRNNTVSPIANQTAKRTAMNKSNLSKLDPTVYLDTQSNGFASRVVKYYEASEAKSRPISNQSYRRPGDFPIVNLEKSELSLNQRKENIPKISKLNIAPPINLVSHASARSAIFRTGKNYGETIGPIVKGNNSNNTSSSNKTTEPLPSANAHDEPIVSNESDYNGASARSSLDALKEISRKRIRCEELDGEHDKRKKPENSAVDYDSTDGMPFGVATKRTRDRISPTNSSPAAEAQNKRYRNNDILSSLSSSALINTTKRVLDYDLVPSKRHEPEKMAVKAPVNDIIPVSARPSIKDGLNRIGASNSDLPHHKPAQYPKIVSKSMSDSAVGAEQQITPQKQASKMPKLTLFNKDYGTSIPQECKGDVEQEEEDENSISFVKPKSSTSTIFSLIKKKDSSKTKLAMMLSFLRGDESKDEVDTISASNKIVNTEKKEEDKDSKSANLSTSTVVTFSTATTTSVLNSSTSIPSSLSTVSTNPSESSAKVTQTSKEISKIETISKPSITFSPMPTSSKPVLSTAQTNNEEAKNEQAKKEQAKNEQAKNEQKVLTTSFTIPKSPKSPNKTIVTSNITESSPRLGGFAFSAIQTSPPSISNGSNSVSKSEAIQSVSLNTSSAPTFSFGASKPSLVSSALAKPTFSFGSTKVDDPPKSTPTLSSSGLASTAPVMNSNIAFNLGSSIPKPAQPESNKISFALPTTNTMSTTVQSAPVTSAPVGFSFGGPGVLKNANTSSNILPTNTASSVFAFGGNKSSTPAAESPFGSVKSPSTALPTFGSVTNTNNNTPQFGGNSQLTFGSNNNQALATTTASAPIFGSNTTSGATNSGGNLFQFGNNAKPNVTTQSNTLGMSSNLSTTSAPTNNIFGTTGLSATAKPFAFGSKTEIPLNNSAITTTTATPSIFGSPSIPTTAPPAFGSTAAQPSSFATANNNTNNSFGGFSSTFGQPNKTVPSFGNSTNTITTTASTNMFGISSPPAYGSTNNIFGSANTAQNTSTFGGTNSAQNTPAFGFSNPSITQANQNAFSFGQTQSPVVQQSAAITTASIFGSGQTNTNTNTFVFGQSNAVPQASSNPAVGIFGAKPTENNSQTMTAPPSFGSSTNSVFNFTPKPNMFGNSNATSETKPAFSFNSPSNNATSVGAFGSAPSFGSPAPNNNTNQSFAFGAQSTQDPPKPFNFNSGPTSAPTQGTSAPFSFSAPNPNSFQFNAVQQQPATANIFSIGPGTPTTTKTGRPMRTATRRIK